MNILQSFLVLMFLPVLRSKNHCPTSYCPNSTLPIQYPFKLPDQQTPNCTYYTNLRCSNQGIATVELPRTGNFNIRDVDYAYTLIKLYDPENCLPKRLMSFTLSYSDPLSPLYYQNYTFYTCPSDAAALAKLPTIGCLSNSSTSTVATHTVSSEVMTKLYQCSEIVTSSVPVGRGPPDFITNETDFVLGWYANDCETCPFKAAGLVSDDVLFFAFAMITYFMVLLPIVICTGCCVHCITMFRKG